MDGRYNPKGEEKDDDYIVMTASEDEEYDFILISVAGGKIEDAMKTLRDIIYGCRCVYDEGKSHGLELPLFYGNMDRVFAEIKD